MTVMRNCIGKPDGENISISSITSLVKIETFPNSYKLMQIALTLPISSSSCERSFSVMRRIKNSLRSSMGQNRFSCLALANIEARICSIHFEQSSFEITLRQILLQLQSEKQPNFKV
nr:unnamed protein product [Callosobruchus chinensis]